MNTLKVRCEGEDGSGASNMNTTKVTIFFASGKRLILFTTSEPDTLGCYVAGGMDDTMVIYPRAANAAWIEVR